MARHSRGLTVGAEQARQRLPELIDRAHRGEATVITKHGRPYAALVPVDAARLSQPSMSLLALRGSGKGLWGNVRRHVESLRREWT